MKNKIFAFSLVTALILTAAVTLSAQAQQTDISEKIIRIHVVANSDSSFDQNLKLKIRDMLLSEYSPIFGALDKPEAAQRIRESHKAMEDSIKKQLSDWGVDYCANVSYAEEYFPERIYEDISLPAGKYDTVKVILGEGAGKNWWCIMFPPLCSPNGEDREEAVTVLKDELTDEEYKLITEGKITYKIKFKILEILADLFK